MYEPNWIKQSGRKAWSWTAPSGVVWTVTPEEDGWAVHRSDFPQHPVGYERNRKQAQREAECQAGHGQRWGADPVLPASPAPSVEEITQKWTIYCRKVEVRAWEGVVEVDGVPYKTTESFMQKEAAFDNAVDLLRDAGIFAL